MTSWRRRVLAGAAAGGASSLLLAPSAGAEQRTITVTLLGGKVVTITVDVPPGTPLDQLKLPDLVAPIVDVTAAPAAPAPAPASATAGPTNPTAARHARRKRSRKASRDATHAPAATAAPADPQALKPRRATAQQAADGTPTPLDPLASFAVPGPAPIGVPNFFIDRFRIPPFLLPIYQAAGIQYGVRWEILAAINEIETDYGRNLNVSSAGAVGWMQFMPATWRRYGVDANDDRSKDPYNPADAIFAAARYLRAAGVGQDVRKAVFAYNHADWYVDSVLLRARLIGGMPTDLVSSLTGLTEGRFPLYGAARYTRTAKRRATNIFAEAGTPAIAVQDGRIVRIGRNAKLGRFVQLRDAYGNTYTYAGLKRLSREYAVLKDRRRVAEAAVKLDAPPRDAAPTSAASAGRQVNAVAVAASAMRHIAPRRERLQANPRPAAALPHGISRYLVSAGDLKRSELTIRPLRRGSRVVAGTVLGRVGVVHARIAPHMRFMIRPAGRGAPQIDPKPVLDGWKLLESTAIYRAKERNPFFGPDARQPSIGQMLLLSKPQLQRRVLSDPQVEIYDGGREDVRSGQIDRRVLATLEFLSASGLKPTVSSLKGNHSLHTASGNISEHSSGNAVDIAKINGIPIVGHQGEGSITDITIRRLLTLQGTMRPHQIISLMSYAGADNTMSLPDHADHIHVGFRPLYEANTKIGRQLDAVLKPGQWIKLIQRIGAIENPDVLTAPGSVAR